MLDGMDAGDLHHVVEGLTARAERLDELADTAELMGDEHTMHRLRRRAAHHRAEALAHLDELG